MSHTVPAVRIFVSHSKSDQRLATAVTELLTQGLPLAQDNVRCTSAEGYGINIGDYIADEVRREILKCEVLIGLVSRSSQKSAWVLMELGARWGTEQSIYPLVVSDTSSDKMEGPISGIHALRCNSEPDLRQLLDNIALQLALKPATSSSTKALIREIIRQDRHRHLLHWVRRSLPFVLVATTTALVLSLFWPPICDMKPRRIALMNKMFASAQSSGISVELNLDEIVKCKGKKLLLLAVKPGPRGPGLRRVNGQKENGKLLPINDTSPEPNYHLNFPDGVAIKDRVGAYAFIINAEKTKEELSQQTIEKLFGDLSYSS